MNRFGHMTAEEYRQAVGLDVPVSSTAQGANKFGAVRTELDGIKFASRREAARYGELLIAQRAGLVRDLEVHPRFILQDDPRITYTADFQYVLCSSGQTIVEDVKGGKATRTEAFSIRARLFRARYRDMTFRVVG